MSMKIKRGDMVQVTNGDDASGSPRKVLQVLDDGRKVDAIRRYAAATGEDLGTAKAVVESLGAAGKR